MYDVGNYVIKFCFSSFINDSNHIDPFNFNFYK